MRKRNWLYFVYYFMYWLSIGCLSPYLGLFYQQRGLNGTQIGILNAVASFATIPAALFIGPLADKSRSPRRILLILLAGIFAVFGVLYSLNGFFLFAFAILIYGFVSNPISDVADTLLMGQIKEKPETYGNYRLGGSGGYMLGVAAAGILFKLTGMPMLFVAACAMLLVTMVVVRMLPVGEHTPKPATAKRVSLYTISKSRAFAPAFLTLLIWGLTDSGAVYFLSLHVVTNGLEASFTSVLIGAVMIGEMIFFLLTPYLLRKLGPLNAMALGFGMQAVHMAALFAIQWLPWYLQIAAQFLGGGAFAMVYASDTEYIRQGFSQDVAYTAQSLKAIANKGIGTGLGALLFGRMLDVVTTNVAFLCMGVVAVVYMLVLLVIHARSKSKEAELNG